MIILLVLIVTTISISKVIIISKIIILTIHSIIKKTKVHQVFEIGKISCT